MSHLGYEFLPRCLLRIPLLRWINTSTFHNLHHTSFKGNYALMFRFWDRVLGTELTEIVQTWTQPLPRPTLPGRSRQESGLAQAVCSGICPRAGARGGARATANVARGTIAKPPTLGVQGPIDSDARVTLR
jgi:Fatty acid hydroxylase superfamily